MALCADGLGPNAGADRGRAARVLFCGARGAGAFGHVDARAAPRAKADLVICDLDEPNMAPMRDPLRTLIQTSGGRSVRDIWVDWRQVAANLRVLTIDRQVAAAALQVEQDRTAVGVPDLDWISPLALEMTP